MAQSTCGGHLRPPWPWLAVTVDRWLLCLPGLRCTSCTLQRTSPVALPTRSVETSVWGKSLDRRLYHTKRTMKHVLAQRSLGDCTTILCPSQFCLRMIRRQVWGAQVAGARRLLETRNVAQPSEVGLLVSAPLIETHLSCHAVLFEP